MHAPPATVGAAGGPAEQLGDELSGWNSLGQGMTVPSVSAEHDVAPRQVGADAGGDRLFPDVRVARTMHQSTLMRPGELFFALPDHLHAAVQVQRLITIEWGSRHFSETVGWMTAASARAPNRCRGKHSTGPKPVRCD